MFLAVLVIEQGFSRNALREILLRDVQLAIPLIRIEDEHLECRECTACITVSKGGDGSDPIIGQMDVHLR